MIYLNRNTLVITVIILFFALVTAAYFSITLLAEASTKNYANDLELQPDFKLSIEHNRVSANDVLIAEFHNHSNDDVLRIEEFQIEILVGNDWEVVPRNFEFNDGAHVINAGTSSIVAVDLSGFLVTGGGTYRLSVPVANQFVSSTFHVEG